MAAKKNKREGRTAIQKVDDALGHDSHPLHTHGAMDSYLDEIMTLQAQHLAAADTLQDRCQWLLDRQRCC